MDYTTLIASKSTPGSIQNWVGYSKVDADTMLQITQAIIFESLRVREMRAEWTFGLSVGQAWISLPAAFLDPIGNIFDTTHTLRMPQIIDGSLQGARAYDNLTGTYGASAFSTQAGSSIVTVNEPNHGLTQDSTIANTGVGTVGGINLDGTFVVADIIDVNNFDIETNVAAASNATAGSAGSYAANRLVDGTATRWAIWNERINFDVALTEATQCKLNYYKRPAYLSASNTSNFLTIRYPHLVLAGALAAAAKLMKDDGEYQKAMGELSALIQSISASNDMFMAGASLGTDTPTPGDYY